MKTKEQKHISSCARVGHDWLEREGKSKWHKNAVLVRLIAEAETVGGDYFFYAKDRLDQGLFTGTQPVALHFGGQVRKTTSWRDVFIKTVDMLEEDLPKELHQVTKSFGNSYVSRSADRMRVPFSHKSGVYIDLGLDPSSIIRNSRKLFKSCGVDLSQVGVVFADRGGVTMEESDVPLRTDFADKAERVGGFLYQYSNVKVRQQEFGGKYPVALLFNEAEYPLEGNWRNILVKTVEALDLINREKLVAAVQDFSASYFSMSDEGMRQPYLHIASGVYIDKYLDPTNCVYYSRKLCQMCEVTLRDIGIVYVDKTSGSAIVAHGRKNVAEDTGYASLLERDIRENYVTGFDFSVSSRRLVEERTGCAFSNAAIHALQERMFERKDGLWFFEDQISDAELRSDIVDQCERWLSENPIVNLNQFVEMVGARSNNLEDDFDKGKYAEYAICRSEFGRRCDFYGKRGGRICFFAEVGAEDSKRAFSEKVEALLHDRFDVVPVSELADLFPMVNADWMVGNLPELIPDAILEDIGDKCLAFKLLEFYYLPDDFEATFQSVIDELASDDEVLSVSRILSALNDCYGYDFRENFALTESTFKQIATRFDRGHRGWTGAILGGVDGGKERLTFRQIVEKQFPRVFSHEEFYQFGATAWGWSEDHRAWHQKQLWNSFIRYDADHWSPVDYFKKATGWNADVEASIEGELKTLLGTSPFFPLGKVPQQFMDRLPNLKIEGKSIRWTLELLASVVYFCLPRVRVLNHAAAPYAVTSLLVPPDVAVDADGVAYMVQVFKLRNPRAPGGDFGDMAYQGLAMKFLIENDVRQKASQKLQAEVAALLKREDI